MAATVRDVMGTVAIAVTMDATFTQLVETMRRYGVGAVTVVDADRRPIGVVSEDDLLLKEIEAGGRPFGHLSRAERRKVTGTTAAELMTTPAITVTVGTPIRDAARLMHRNRIKQLPVIEPATGRIVGTVHQGDLLRVFARRAEEIKADVRQVAERIGIDPARLTMEVESGVLAVRGRVPRRSQVRPFVLAARRVDGVIEVDADLGFDVDDLLISPPMV
ncbi:hypothetical protein TBS_06480 [Thermobispora bispora]|uniref:CBS domain-containing protein n=1 Tax=Thermobispora bispora TaxID=2006 RepID=UPI0030E9CD0E